MIERISATVSPTAIAFIIERTVTAIFYLNCSSVNDRVSRNDNQFHFVTYYFLGTFLSHLNTPKPFCISCMSICVLPFPSCDKVL